MPVLLAVPATIFIADSTVKQFKSTNLSSAIAFTCSQVISPTFLRLGSAEPPFTLPVVITYYSDKSFDFVFKTPTFLRLGSAEPPFTLAASLT